MLKYLFPLILISCGRQQKDHILDPPIYSQVKITREPALENYFKTFDSLFGVNTTYISTEFIKMDDAVGKCYSWSDGTRKISVDPDFWDKANEYEKENLIWHENGHCHFDLDHNTNMICINQDSIPESVMYPSIFAANPNYKAFRNYYIKELKSHVHQSYSPR